VDYTPEEKEILRQHYRRPWQILRQLLTKFYSQAKPWIGWVVYGTIGSYAVIHLAVFGPSIFNAEPFLGRFKSGGIPFNAFSTEVLPGISPVHPLRLSIALVNFFVLIFIFFIIPLLIYRRWKTISTSRLVLIVIFLALGLVFIILGVHGYNQPMFGGAVDPFEFSESFKNN
jgi:hypothetical protein